MSGQSTALKEVAGTMHVRLSADRTDVHVNLAPCIIFGRGRAVSVETPTGLVAGDAVLVDANWQHVVNFHGGSVDVIYLEKKTHRAADGIGACTLPREAVRILESHVENWSVDSSSALCDMFGVVAAARDPDISEIANCIYADPMTRLSETEASRLVGLERTTMLRRFKRETGMTFRAYKRWAALKHASRLFLGGAPLGHSGLDSGFADAAHFSRQFRSTFGLSPTQAIQSVV
jgi:AraC-like DNA-binding protein